MHPLRILREVGHATVEQNKTLLAENVVFHSPVLVKAVTGRDTVAAIFAASASVREGQYVAEHKLDDRTTFLWWKGTIDGHEIESFDVLVDDAQGLLGVCRQISMTSFGPRENPNMVSARAASPDSYLGFNLAR
jgi:hypothetical protein